VRQLVITAGTIAGLILAGWHVLVAQGLLEGLRPDAQDALGAFVNPLVPIVSSAEGRSPTARGVPTRRRTALGAARST
jgi:hypothetical protein